MVFKIHEKHAGQTSSLRKRKKTAPKQNENLVSDEEVSDTENEGTGVSSGFSLHFLDHQLLDRAHLTLDNLSHQACDKAEELARKVRKAGDKVEEMARQAGDKVEEIASKVWQAGWEVVHHHHLPAWLKDNDFLVKGHRPQLNSFCECFKSIFRIHTETGNIWTHLLGFLAFLCITVYYLLSVNVGDWHEKVAYMAFFIGAILCLGFSWVFHTVYCHSEHVGKVFCKLDYCGIALLTVGSFVPWLHYIFYCRLCHKIIYMALMIVLGIVCIGVSLWDKFAEPRFRPLRAATFIGLGLSGLIPVSHFVITDGFWTAINVASLGWLALMALLYISGAVIYACRFPERIWPGKFDIWFQSHQIFHVFVIAAAFVHFHGINEIATNRLSLLKCLDD